VFDHILVDEQEVEKFTAGGLAVSHLKQSLLVPFAYDIQVLLYFLYAHFANVKVTNGQDEVEATLTGRTSKYDLRIQISGSGSKQDKGVVLKYFYSASVIKVGWLASPANDSLADSICLLLLEIKDRATPQLLKMLEITKQGRAQ
jgi:hypothetical protein